MSAALAAKNPDNLFLRELAHCEAARLASPAGSSSPGPRSNAIIIATTTARLWELDIALAANPTDEGLQAQRAAPLDDLEAASARVLAADTASPRKRAQKISAGFPYLLSSFLSFRRSELVFLLLRCSLAFCRAIIFVLAPRLDAMIACCLSVVRVSMFTRTSS
jgi:hypothetical protein